MVRDRPGARRLRRAVLRLAAHATRRAWSSTRRSGAATRITGAEHHRRRLAAGNRSGSSDDRTCSPPASTARPPRSTSRRTCSSAGSSSPRSSIAVCAVIWGGDGAWSSAYGVALVLVNFLLAAGIIAVDGPHLARGDARRGAVRLPAPPRADLPRRVARQGRRVDFAAGARGDHNRHAPRAPGVGAEVRGALAHVPGPQAGRAATTPAAPPTDTDRTITTSPPTT